MTVPKLAELISIEEFARLNNVKARTMRARIDRLQREGPCPWIVEAKCEKKRRRLINVRMMREANPAMFDPEGLTEIVEMLGDRIARLQDVVKGHEMRIKALEK